MFLKWINILNVMYLVVIIYYGKVLYNTVKHKCSIIEYFIGFNIKVNDQNKKLIIFSSALNILLMASSLYVNSTKDNSQFISISLLVFALNVFYCKEKLKEFRN